MSHNLDKKIIEAIKKKHIKPKPRWQFILKNYAIWIIGIFAFFIGALSISVIIYLLLGNDWNIYGEFNFGLGKFIFLTLPYFWLLVLSFFIFIVYYNIKHTKKGYRYPFLVIIILIVALSILLGGLFFRAGLGRDVDDILGKRAPFYERIFNCHLQFWSQPEKGRLVGLVVSQPADNKFIILDHKQKEWQVEYGENTLGYKNIKNGQPIKILGKIKGENKFKAIKVESLGPGRGFFRRKYFRKNNFERMFNHKPLLYGK